MPMNMRTLKALLRRRGFTSRPGKGSHSVWIHPSQPDMRFVLSGADGCDAKRYQVARLRKARNRLEPEITGPCCWEEKAGDP